MSFWPSVMGLLGDVETQQITTTTKTPSNWR